MDTTLRLWSFEINEWNTAPRTCPKVPRPRPEQLKSAWPGGLSTKCFGEYNDPRVAPERIGQYVVLSRIGAGGMGEVFLAQDERLQRRVAIKRVRPDAFDPHAGRRLLTEARAAGRLDHPNICTIHDAGEDDRGLYLVMPFVEGETLAARIARSPLDIDEAISAAAQVADALAAAHAQGILHRDIKPANIMIDGRGRVRVMDFGLAKVMADRSGSASDLETASRLTTMGTVVGTAAYMSPEQARGDAVDARSDIFALGVVLYEMVGGRRPFEGPTAADTISALLTREPPPLDRLRPEASGDVLRVVAKALRKLRDERYQTASDLLVDLRALQRPAPAAAESLDVPPIPEPRSRVWIVAAALALVVAVGYGGWRMWGDSPARSFAMPSIESLAVLPLENMSGDKAQDYFADGMTEALTNELGSIKSLNVKSRTSTMQYRASRPSMPDIARALGADALVEGSVIRDGDRVRITAQLIHGPTDRHLWSDSYDGDLRDILALQRRVALAIAREVRAAIAPQDQRKSSTARAIDPRSQDAYLRGRQLFFAGTNTRGKVRAQFLEQAIAAYTEALALEPEWAEAWAGIAAARHWMVGAAPDDRAWFEASREAALKAIAFDPLVVEGHGALAYVSAAHDADAVTAELEFKRTLDLNPSSGHRHGYAMLLSALGRHDEAAAMFVEAKKRDPAAVVLRVNEAWDRLRARQYGEALRLASDLLAQGTDPSAPMAVTTWAHLWDGRRELALDELEPLRPTDSHNKRLSHIAVLACAGRAAEARKRLRDLEGADSVASLELARVHACLGQADRALDALENARAARATWMLNINVEQAFDAIRDDPRFQALLRSMGIPSRR